MAEPEKIVRQTVSLPPRIASRVKALARGGRTSANRVLVDLIESGLEARDAEKERFFALTDRLTEAKSAAERRRIKEELARLTFGD
jgi:hypothetical protein